MEALKRAARNIPSVVKGYIELHAVDVLPDGFGLSWHEWRECADVALNADGGVWGLADLGVV